MCLAFDQRGWGHSVESPKEQGDTGGTTQVMNDITCVLSSKLPSSVPLFLMGHSMGGALALYYAAHGPKETVKQLSGFVSLSPWIDNHPKVKPWAITILVGHIVARFIPRHKIKVPLNPAHISRDPKANQDFIGDPLCHDMATLQTMDGCLTRAAELTAGKALPQNEVRRLMLAHGSDDFITSFAASKRYFERIAVVDRTSKWYTGAYHCGTSPTVSHSV
jgi:acylglycerol lipase